jgi:hypothetical protein
MGEYQDHGIYQESHKNDDMISHPETESPNHHTQVSVAQLPRLSKSSKQGKVFNGETVIPPQ